MNNKQKTDVITTIHLSRLLQRLLDNSQLNICIRTRCLGEMWHPNFMRVLMITPKGAIIFHDEVQRKAITVLNIKDIVQFEIDQPFEDLEPHSHYVVQPVYDYE